MALPTSGRITLRDILTEFNAPAGTRLSQMVRGGEFVPDHNANKSVPTSKPVHLRDFYGAQLDQPGFTIPFVEDSLSPWFQPSIERFYVDPPTISAPASQLDPTERVQFDIRVKCGNQIDSGNLPPQMPGYSFHRERLKMFFGLYQGDPDLAFNAGAWRGLFLDLHTTDNARGYVIATLGRGLVSASGSGFAFDFGDMSQYAFQGRNPSDYGAIIPTETRSVRLRVRRGFDGTTPFFDSGIQRYAPLWRVDLFLDELGDPASTWRVSSVYAGDNIRVGPKNGSVSNSVEQAIKAQGYPCMGVSIYNSGGRSDAVVEEYEITQ